MEITELNLIGDFEAGMKCLQNPSLISKLSLIDKLPQFYSFWTCGALIIAVFATFTNVFNKIKLFIYQIRLRLINSCQNSCPQQIFDDDDFDFDFSDDDYDDTPSSVAESDNEELESEDEDRVNAVFRAEGSLSNLSLRRRNGFSWSDFSAGKSVVQLWDSFGLGLDFEDDESEHGGEIAIWDLDRDVKLSSGRRLQVAAASPAEKVVLTAEMDDGTGKVGFGTYDCRVNGRTPAIYAAWRPRQRNLWSHGDGVAGQKEE
ncbi:hypothetical protein R6Q59_002702 [Mikania micrantha]|uniref:Uncharacterized protein n=1 Tax=Mikania micrantha TaxID=192012 RepID=A0A5N6NRT0_9ASTR|nr:hypothetical protein E3N88_19724 [Mikania micrantha]